MTSAFKYIKFIFFIGIFFVNLVACSQDKPAEKQRYVNLEKAKVTKQLNSESFKLLQNLTDNQKALTFKTGEYDLIIIDFWASWCMPCLQSIPFYDSLLLKTKKKILFIPVSIDTTEKMALSFKNKIKNIKSSLYWDKDKVLKSDFTVEVLPYMFVYDKDLNFKKEYRGFDLDKKKKIYEDLFLN